MYFAKNNWKNNIRYYISHTFSEKKRKLLYIEGDSKGDLRLYISIFAVSKSRFPIKVEHFLRFLNLIQEFPLPPKKGQLIFGDWTILSSKSAYIKISFLCFVFATSHNLPNSVHIVFNVFGHFDTFCIDQSLQKLKKSLKRWKLI